MDRSYEDEEIATGMHENDFTRWHFPENEREHEMEVIGSAKHVVNPNCTKENKKGQ